jgi:two-component system, sensor histidine kinase and response regulator
MAEERSAEQTLLLSMLPAGPAERRFALAAVLVSLAVFVAVVPFARMPLPGIRAFIPGYEAALVVTDLSTAALLFGQFAIARSRALLVLASGYVFTALMCVVYGLSFPGLFAHAGLLGAGPEISAWIYMFWHAGFPIAVAAYALLKEDGTRPSRRAPPAATALAVTAVFGLAAALTGLATAGAELLPSITMGEHYTPAMFFVVGAVWILNFPAAVMLLTRRTHAILDLWLLVVLCAWVCDIGLSAVFNAGRFDVGFYVGRLYGLFAAGFVLVALLLETVGLYARLASSIAAERQERERRLHEMRSELIHVARLGELGQMVSALAHEVNQPLTALSNYIRGSQLLVRAGEAEKAEAALAKAAGEAVRAREIIRRLRDFIRKNEGAMCPEQLGPTIEEIVVLATAGGGRRDVEVSLQLHPAAEMAVIDKVQIQQVLLNLIRNAIEAMAGGARQSLVIATRPAAGDMVEVSVADSGPGLSQEVRSRLFQPFVTTKSSGMGVGLSICYAIIEAHGGQLWAEDGAAGGTVFRFTLPRPATPAEAGAST